MLEPYQKSELKYKVEWNEHQDETREVVEDAECAEDNPICKPLFLFSLVAFTERDEALEGRIGDGHQTSNIVATDTERDCCNSENESVLGKLSFVQPSQ